MFGTIFAILLIGAGVLAYVAYASYNIESGFWVPSVCRRNDVGRAVCLTFDDGPDPERTPRILEILRENHIKAMFFLIGKEAEKHPDLVRQIAAEGHVVGVHAWHHSPRFCFFRKAKMLADVQRAQQVLFEILGKRIALFRPPLGVTNPSVRYVVKQMNLTVVGWSVRSFDTNLKKSRQQIHDRITARLHDGAVILLHDNRPDSDVLLKMLIETLKKENYNYFML